MEKLIIANWKMNMPELKQWRGFRAPRGVHAVICPPFPFLSEARNAFSRSNAKLGVQDVFWEEKGAFTGEVSSSMAKKEGAEYAIVGHSERRTWLHETDEVVNKKLLAALREGLTVVLCVGEPLTVRRTGFAAAKRFVKNQLLKDLKNAPRSTLHAPRLVIAYEPIWAIGTGHPDKPEETAEMARFIKGTARSTLHAPRFTFQVLYGGSVNGANAKSFLHYREIDGALVGGASLNAKEFNKITGVCASVIPAKAGIHAPVLRYKKHRSSPSRG